MRSERILAIVVLTSAFFAGCTGTTCPLLGCQDGLQVGFTAAAWPAGVWSVQLETAGATRSCSVSLPFASVNVAPVCVGSMTLGTSGSALPADQHKLTGVQLPDTPTQITLTVQHDGATVATKNLQPTYVTSQPNGPECEPTCNQGTAQLSW